VSIPLQMREEMGNDPYYKKCCITGSTFGKIDFHHNLRFGGKNVQEKFCILPLSKAIHDKIDYYKEQCDWIMWNRASLEEIRRYSKAENYFLTLERLNKKYGEYKEL
jgi:hypothetical protein